MQHRNGLILDQVLDLLGRCLTADTARAVVDFRLDPASQARLDELADKNAESTLTAEERREYEEQVRAINNISILQARHRRLLGTKAKAS